MEVIPLQPFNTHSACMLCVCVFVLECGSSVAAAAAALQTGLRFGLVVAVLHLENQDLDLR